MTRWLGFLLGRIPIGWLQLVHSRTRLIAAVAGVAFANLLVFVQLGVVGSINNLVELTYTPFDADIIISPPGAELFAGAQLPRRIMYMALAEPGVVDAVPLYLDSVEWKRPDGISKSLLVYGMAPEATAFAGDVIGARNLAILALQDRVLLDSEFEQIAVDPEALSLASPVEFEINGRAVSAIGSFRFGSGFAYDGALFVSDQTFQRLAGRPTSGTPSHILLRVQPESDPAVLVKELGKRLASEQVQVRTVEQAIADDLSYMNTQSPMGIIFGSGLFIGVLVGVVIVYQVLAADVAAHIKEYATFKAMGFTHRFLLGVVFEEALIIAFLGFVPGFVLSAGTYAVMAAAAGLPINMTTSRALAVFAGSFVACAISGALVTLRLRSAEPAELF